MIFDMNQPTIAFDGIIQFPDFVFANLPTPAAMMHTKVQLIGSDATNMSLQGSSTTIQVTSPGIVFPGS